MNPLIIIPIVLVSFLAGCAVFSIVSSIRHHAGYLALGFDDKDKTAVYQIFLNKHPYKVAKSKYIILDVEIADWVENEEDVSMDSKDAK